MQLSTIPDQFEISYPIGRHISEAIKFIITLKNHIVTYDLFPVDSIIILWCRGSSGSILAALFSQHLISLGYQIYIHHVKKPGEDSHSSKSYLKTESYHFNVIIDDFVASGETITAIAKDMAINRIEKIDCLIVSGANLIKESNNNISLNHPIPSLLITGSKASKKAATKLVTSNLRDYFNV